MGRAWYQNQTLSGARALGLLSLGIAVLSSAVHAGQTVRVGSRQLERRTDVEVEKIFQWTEPNSRVCDQTCIYEKENNTMAQRALQLNLLRAQLKKDDALINQSVPGFCAGGETDIDCTKRYLAGSQLELIRIRRAIIENQNIIFELQSDTIDIQVEDVDPFAERNKPAIVPNILTADQMDLLYNDLSERLTNEPGELERRKKEWLEITLAEPRPQDFPLFKEVPRDDSDPDDPTLTVVQRCDGQPCMDEARFVAARDEYYSRFHGGTTDGTPGCETQACESHKKMVEKAKTNSLPDLKATSLEDDVGAVTYDSVLDSRVILISATNHQINLDARPKKEMEEAIETMKKVSGQQDDDGRTPSAEGALRASTVPQPEGVYVSLREGGSTNSKAADEAADRRRRTDVIPNTPGQSNYFLGIRMPDFDKLISGIGK